MSTTTTSQSLNRLAWLRTSPSFLNAIIKSSDTRWLLFNSGKPLVISGSGTRQKLAYLTTHDVKPFLGEEPYFGQGEAPGTSLTTVEEMSSTEACRHLGLPIVFLGIREPENANNALPLSEFKDAEEAVKRLDGTPYFSIEIADLNMNDAQLQVILSGTELAISGQLLSWSEARMILTSLEPSDVSVFSEARSMVDWNQRNKFCPACGSRVYSLWGGWKLSCSTLLPWADVPGQKPCSTAKGLHNFTHPRTDPVVIMIAIDAKEDKILLGRNRRFPGKFYSALAGFMEPGETLEDSVRREMWEEAGVTVWNIKYHSGQPWPYPANLMVGFYAEGDSSKPVRTDLDNELVDAQWFPRSEIEAVLAHPTGAYISSRDYRTINEVVDGVKSTGSSDGAPKPQVEEPPFRVPPTSAIAGVLIRDWAEGRIGFPPRSGADIEKNRLSDAVVQPGEDPKANL